MSAFRRKFDQIVLKPVERPCGNAFGTLFFLSAFPRAFSPGRTEGPSPRKTALNSGPLFRFSVLGCFDQATSVRRESFSFPLSPVTLSFLDLHVNESVPD